jgi:hypothetical protein
MASLIKCNILTTVILSVSILGCNVSGKVVKQSIALEEYQSNNDSNIESSSAYLDYRQSIDETLEYLADKDTDSSEFTLQADKNKQKNTLTQDLKIAIINDSSFNQASIKDISTTSNLFLQEVGDAKLQVTNLQLKASDLATSIKSLKEDGTKVIISPSSGAFAKAIADEVAKDSSMLFVNLSNFKNIKDYKSVVSFGYEVSDQFEAILNFAMDNKIHNLSLMAPSTKLGAQMSLVLSKTIADFAKTNKYKIVLRNTEFYNNKEPEPTIQEVEEATQTTAETSPQQEATVQDKSVEQSNDNTQDVAVVAVTPVKEEESRVSSKFYLKKILMSHLRQIEKIDNFVIEQKLTQTNPSESSQMEESKDQSKTAKSIAQLKWNNEEEALEDKKTILFFTGTPKDKEQIMAELARFRAMRYYAKSNQNLFLFTDSFMEAYLSKENQKTFNDIFFPYQSYLTSTAFKDYFKSKTQNSPTRLSGAIFDSLSFVYNIFTNPNQEQNAFGNLQKSLDAHEGINMNSSEGDYVLLDKKIKRNYSVMYIDQNFSLAQVAKPSLEEIIDTSKPAI